MSRRRYALPVSGSSTALSVEVANSTGFEAATMTGMPPFALAYPAPSRVERSEVANRTMNIGVVLFAGIYIIILEKE